MKNKIIINTLNVKEGIHKYPKISRGGITSTIEHQIIKQNIYRNAFIIKNWDYFKNFKEYIWKS